jgi:hypothetical protein
MRNAHATHPRTGLAGVAACLLLVLISILPL